MDPLARCRVPLRLDPSTLAYRVLSLAPDAQVAAIMPATVKMWGSSLRWRQCLSTRAAWSPLRDGAPAGTSYLCHRVDFSTLSTSSRGAKNRVRPQLQHTTTSNVLWLKSPCAPGSRSNPKWLLASAVVARRSSLAQFGHGATFTFPPQHQCDLDRKLPLVAHAFDGVRLCRRQADQSDPIDPHLDVAGIGTELRPDPGARSAGLRARVEDPVDDVLETTRRPLVTRIGTNSSSPRMR